MMDGWMDIDARDVEEMRTSRDVDVEMVEVTHTMLCFSLEVSCSAQQVGRQAQSDLSDLAEPDV